MDTPSRNIEIKAKVRDIDELLVKVKQLSGKDGVVLNQQDAFFHTPNPSGRLKLREENGTGTLISYNRPNTEGPKLSSYVKCHVDNPPEMAAVLSHALGVKGSVKKQRFLFLVGQTRVHIDKVEGLGNFMELEVVLSEEQSMEEGQAIANHLMSKLGIPDSDLLAGAYMDMLSQPS